MGKLFDPAKKYRELLDEQAVDRESLRRQIHIAELERIRSLERRVERTSEGPRKHIVIPDSHAHPDVPRDYYYTLGKFIQEHEPEVVVDIGDWWDMDSLNPYDKNRRCYSEGAYTRDIEAGIEAQELFKEGLGGYKPKLQARTLGNHENRITKVSELEPLFSSLVHTGNLESAKYGWEQIPFLKSIVIDGVSYRHYWESPGTGKAIGGVLAARNFITKKHISTVVGHGHKLLYYEEADGNGRKLCALQVGCYFPQHAAYARDDNEQWRRGVPILNDVHNGEFSIEWWDFDRIQRRYGGR